MGIVAETKPLFAVVVAFFLAEPPPNETETARKARFARAEKEACSLLFSLEFQAAQKRTPPRAAFSTLAELERCLAGESPLLADTLALLERHLGASNFLPRLGAKSLADAVARAAALCDF